MSAQDSPGVSGTKSWSVIGMFPLIIHKRTVDKCTHTNTHTCAFSLILICLKIYSHTTAYINRLWVSPLFYYTHLHSHGHANTHDESVWADVAYASPSSVADGPADYQPRACLLVISSSAELFWSLYNTIYSSVTLLHLSCRWKSR